MPVTRNSVTLCYWARSAPQTMHRGSLVFKPMNSSAGHSSAPDEGRECRWTFHPSRLFGSFVGQLINWNSNIIRLWHGQQFDRFDGFQTADQCLAYSVHAVHHAPFGIDDVSSLSCLIITTRQRRNLNGLFASTKAKADGVTQAAPAASPLRPRPHPRRCGARAG